MSFILNKIFSVILSIGLLLTGVFPGLAGEKTEIPIEDIIVEEKIDYSVGVNTIKNKIISSYEEWLTIEQKLYYKEKADFDVSFFDDYSLAVHVAFKSGGGHKIKATLAVQDKFTVTVHFKQFETSGITTDDVPPVLIIVPVNKTVVKAEFISDGSESPGEAVMLSPETAKMVNLGTDSKWDNYGKNIYYNYDKWVEAFGSNNDVMNLGYDKAYFEEGALAAIVIVHPNPDWHARVDYIVRKTFELRVFYTRVTEEEIPLEVISYELIVVPIDKNIMMLESRCIGEERPGIQDFYTVSLDKNDFDMNSAPTIFADFDSWIEIFKDVEAVETLGFDEEFFEEYSLAVTTVTLSASNYWIEIYSVKENEEQVKVLYYEVYEGEGVTMVSDELFIVPVSKTVTQAEFDSLGTFDLYEMLSE